MSLQGLIKTGVLIGNVALLTGGYVLVKMLYNNYLNFKKEAKRLEKGGQSNYQYLVDAFNKEGKVGEVVQINNLSFIGTSEPIAPTTFVHSKINNIEKYICIKGVLHEYNRDIIQTQWIKAFNLKDENNHQVTILVNNKESFMPSLFKRVYEPKDDQTQGQLVKEAFSVKVTETGIAFGSNLYVFGSFIKNKLGQIQCVESKLICNASDAKSQTSIQSYIFWVGAACVVTCCLLISGITLYLTFSDSDEKKNKQQSAIRR
ncbi:unnamed protein product [Paramecium primaurelia]|uniref:Uncharacterized protein n=1 Tax=Paramecium primaurelia TaxID=5886 RepID=A0A8S1MXZ0_PARPR|nr:unnamed protein product [Paramecium primaurelia]